MGGKQLGFSRLRADHSQKAVETGFSADMEAVVPWQALFDLIEPHYPKASKKGGQPSLSTCHDAADPLTTQWYSLSDPAMEEALLGGNQ